MNDLPHTITLHPPVAFEGGSILVLPLREPTQKEVEDAEAAAAKSSGLTYYAALQAALLSAVTGLPKQALLELPISIFNDAARLLINATNEGNAVDDRKPGEALEVPVEPPIVSGGIIYSTLRMSEPKTRFVRVAEQAMGGSDDAAAARRYQAALVRQVADVPLAVVQAMPISLVNRAAAFCLGFQTAGRSAGPT